MNEHRVLPSGSELVRRTLLDFRLQENGKKWIVRMKGEGRFRSSVFPEFNETGRRVLLEFVPESEWQRPSLFWRWAVALRVPYLLFSLLPFVLVTSSFWKENRSLPMELSGLLLITFLLVQCSCSLWSEFEDHLRGVDAPEHFGGSGVIQNLWIPAVHLRNAAAVLMTLGVVAGFFLLSLLPLERLSLHLAWLGFLGAIGAASYSGWPFHYKYFGLGEPIVFFLSGPIVTMGSSLVLFQNPKLFLFFSAVSLPLAFLAILRLHCGNMQRIPFDKMAGVSTIANQLGFFWSRAALYFLFAAPFLCLFFLWWWDLVPNACLVAFFSAPLTALALVPLAKAQGPLDPGMAELRLQSGRFHFVFGFAYALGFLF